MPIMRSLAGKDLTMPTQAEDAINRATVEVKDSKGKATGARKLVKPNVSSDEERAQFRITPTVGGYFMEEALMGGRYWLPRAWKLTDSGIGADEVPAYVWDEREARAAEQAEAIAVLRAAKIDPEAPLADYEDADSSTPEVRRAARTLRGLRWLIVWPAEVVAAHIGAYQRQWGSTKE